ncbi:MAG: dipeptidase [Synergistaceae bacterium]|jgi:membrane dipeptidase|nr:dipeptidase [Synergistaceae bacterium]
MSTEAYSYLKDPKVLPVELAPDTGGPWDHVLELPPEQEERAARLHKNDIVFDLHNHVHRLAKNMLRDFETYARSGRVANGYDGIAKSGLTACFNGYGGSAGRRSSPVAWQFDDIVWDIGTRQADIYHHSDVAIVGVCVADIYRAKETGRCAIFANVENAGITGNEIDRLDLLYGIGVRCLGLSYNQRNTIADGSSEKEDGGLSRFGEKVVTRLNRLGVLMDFAHSSDRAILDCLELSDAPCCISHSLPAALSSHPKAKSDDLLKKIAEAGWVIGIQSVPNITSSKPYQSIFDVADQIDHCVQVMGINHVAVGTDAMFGNHADLHRCISKMMAHPEKELVGEYVDYLENPGEIPNVSRVLVSRGYSDEDIGKILGMNVVRLLEKTIG